MLDKDATGYLDAAKKQDRERETISATHSTYSPKDANCKQTKPIDELDSDGSGDAFSATEEVRE